MFTQTLESHLEEKTKLYDELKQQYYKVLEQKVEQVRGPPPTAVHGIPDLHTHSIPTQVQSVQEKMNAAGKIENEHEEKKTEADECRTEEEKGDRVLVEDGEESKNKEQKDMKVSVMEPQLQNDQVFWKIQIFLGILKTLLSYLVY